VIFAEIHYRAISVEFVAIWCHALADIEPELLDRACEYACKHCKFFPTPADIRGQIDQAESNARKIEAEAAWNRVLKAASLGGRFEDFDALTQKALGHSGWSYLIHCDSYEGARFAEKQFISCHIRLRETCQAEHLLGEGEAKKIIRQLASGQPKQPARQLPSVAAPAARAEPPEAAELQAIRSEFATLRAAVETPEAKPEIEPKAAMSDAEFRSRKELLRRQAQEIQRSA
jgi:hypothetical protein